MGHVTPFNTSRTNKITPREHIFIIHCSHNAPSFLFASVAVSCFVLLCVAVCCSVLQCVAVCCSVLQCVAVCCSVLQCVAVCCSVLQCVAACCRVTCQSNQTQRAYLRRTQQSWRTNLEHTPPQKETGTQEQSTWAFFYFNHVPWLSQIWTVTHWNVCVIYIYIHMYTRILSALHLEHKLRLNKGPRGPFKYIYIYIYIYICMHIHIYVYIYIYVCYIETLSQ